LCLCGGEGQPRWELVGAALKFAKASAYVGLRAMLRVIMVVNHLQNAACR
jgi:hypothetical protein